MRIMIADDEALLREFMTRIVTELKPDDEVNAFGDTDALLDEARTDGIDVAFLDICMPEINGIDLAKKLTEINPKVNIIFVTGYNDYREAAMDMFASGYVKKPATREKISEQLEHLRYDVVPRGKMYVSAHGVFEARVNGRLIQFERKKTTELLAYLVFKCGKATESADLRRVLFPSAESQDQSNSYFSHCKRDIKETLAAVGADDVLMFRANRDYAIDITKIESDMPFAELSASIGEIYGWKKR